MVSEGLEPPPLAVWRRRSAAELTDRCYARPERFELPPSRFVAGRSLSAELWAPGSRDRSRTGVLCLVEAALVPTELRDYGGDDGT